MTNVCFVLRVALLVGASALVSCSQSSQCGDGTMNSNGMCILGPEACTDGTRLNLTTNACEIDPSACRGGTVLVNHRCQDPTTGFAIDIEEGPEPNGIARFDSENGNANGTVLEDGWRTGGEIQLKPMGGPGVVIHGCVVPRRDKADFDGYTLTVSEPTLLHVSVDGVNGLSAGFLVVADVESIPSDGRVSSSTASLNYQLRAWMRLGIDGTADSSQREVFLPAAGRYRLFVSDTRTIIPIINKWTSNFTWQYAPIAAGNPDGSGCYYATIDQRPIAPQPLDLARGDSGTLQDTVKFYTARFGDGFTAIRLAADDPPCVQAPCAIGTRAFSLFLNNNRLRQMSYDGIDGYVCDTGQCGSGGPVATGRDRSGELFFGGVRQGDQPLLVLDYLYSVGTPKYRVSAGQHFPAQALPTTGTTIFSTVNGSTATRYSQPEGFPELIPSALNLFYYDVAAADDSIGMNVQFSIPVQGDIYDPGGEPFAWFTNVMGDFANGVSTFTEYQGGLRAQEPGRYYFWVYGPRNTPGDAFTVTSTIRTLTPTRFAIGASSGTVSIDSTFGSAPVILDPGPGAIWQLWNATGTDMAEVVAIARSAAAAYGRLDELTSTTGSDPPTIDNGQPADIALRFPPDGSHAQGAVVSGLVGPLHLNVRASNAGAHPTVNLTATTRQLAHDFGALGLPTTSTITAQALGPSDQQRYHFTAPFGSKVTISATPTAGLTGDRLVIATLNRDESDAVVFDTPEAGVESAEFIQDYVGFTAFVVRSAAGTAGTYDVSISIAAGP